MANSPSNQPARSISLPSRPHPIVPQIHEYLCSLKFSESGSASLGQKLSNLKDLYDCLDDLILLPQNQSKLTQNARRVDELLDGSLRLLDVCSNAKDVLSQSKEHIKEIQSSLRRRANGELSIGNEIFRYVNMRKKSKAMMKGWLKDVKGLVKRFGFGEENKEDGNVIEVSRDVEGVTAQVFEALLGLLSGSKGHSLKRSASLPFVMCRLMTPKNAAFDKLEGSASSNEFEQVDEALSALILAQKKRTRIDVVEAENLRTKMVKLDSSIQDLDEALEGLFRCLLKTRATLLNILSQ